MIVITGASGNIGSRLTDMLLRDQQKIRVVSRTEDKVAQFKKRGAETAIGNFLDADFCQQAFTGCEKAFLVVQGNPNNGQHTEEEIQMGQNFARALTAADVKHAVFSSSLGADKNTGAPIIDCKLQVENILKDSGVPITVLRPGNFLENMYAFLETISSGFFTHPLDGGIKTPHVSVRDIALIAKRAFERGPKGFEIYDMPGAAEYSMRDIATAISNQLNRMIKYMRISDDQFIEVFTGFGISQKFCDDILSMFHYFERAEFSFDRTRVAHEFNYTPTTLEQFVPELVKMIK